MVSACLHLPCTVDVNLAFQQAMVRVGVNREKMAKQFELTVPYSKLGGKKKKEASSMKVVGCGASAWDQLSLCHSTQWPLHTLFTPPILHKLVNCPPNQ